MKRLAAAVVLATAVAGFTTASRAPAAAGGMQFSACSTFTANSWVNPYPPNDTGTLYQINMNAKPFSCSQAQVWVKKFVAQRILGPLLGSVKLKGGPAGYKCQASPDKNYHAYQGACIKISKDPFAPSFNWGPGH
jgi:hypothetical protein